MADLDENIFNDEIEALGSTVVVKNLSDNVYNSRGDDTSRVTKKISTKAVVDNRGGNTDFKNEGVYGPDDKIFVLQGTVSVSLRDKIEYQGNDYEVEEILKGELQDVNFVTQVAAKKV